MYKELSTYLREKQNTEFKWGENDCFLFALKWHEKLTGEDLYTRYSGYEDEKSVLESVGKFGDIQEVLCKHLGPGHKNVLRAKRGDIVIMKLPEYTCGIVDDSGQYIAALSKRGLVRLPLKKAWRIWSY